MILQFFGRSHNRCFLSLCILLDTPQAVPLTGSWCTGTCELVFLSVSCLRFLLVPCFGRLLSFAKALVERTRTHPKFTANYSFVKDASWITAPPCGDDCGGLPQVVALDCEMCLSEVRHACLRHGAVVVSATYGPGDVHVYGYGM